MYSASEGFSGRAGAVAARGRWGGGVGSAPNVKPGRGQLQPQPPAPTTVVGGVGSRAKALRTKKRLAAKGFAEADITRVRMPVGIEIGARRPAEIAVAIAAELVRLRAEREGTARMVGEPDETMESARERTERAEVNVVEKPVEEVLS